MESNSLSANDKKRIAEELKQLLKDSSGHLDDISQRVNQLEEKVGRYAERVEELPSFIRKTNEEFEKYTSLTDTDVGFLMFAVALQTARQVVVNLFKERISDQEAAKNTMGHHKEKTDRQGKKYYASVDEIIKNPVPFDAIRKEVNVKNSINNPKISGFNHRFKALGHDPYLGLVFGTANIMTSTITVNEGFFGISSYHVHTGTYLRQGKEVPTDKMYESASTMEIFENVFQRLREEGKEGVKALAVSLFKECVHLRSDLRTKKSLPLPLLSLTSPNLTRVLGYCELDYLTVKNIEREYILSVIIDLIIRILYSFCYNEDKDVSKELYRARMLKILMYSNEMVMVSSTVQTAIRMAVGDITSAKYFDFGGAFNTMYRVFTTPQKIAQIKHEYLYSKSIDYIKLQNND